MEKRRFGNTDLGVSPLGFGAGHIGGPMLGESEAGRILNSALDLGITLIDTARSYGMSEERIGRHLAHRRSEFVLSTKVGYGIAGYNDWTYDCVRAGIDEALWLLRTNYIDIVHLHSCPVSTLEWGESLRALEDAVRQGKVRVAAYSGENDALEWAIDSRRFGGVEHSLSICDQRVIDGALPRASGRGLGVIAKRPAANAPWRFHEPPQQEEVREYWWRFRTMNLDAWGLEWPELALRFSAFTPGVHSCIAGTSNLDHLRRNASFIEKGPLPTDLVASIRRAFASNDPGWWVGQV